MVVEVYAKPASAVRNRLVCQRWISPPFADAPFDYNGKGKEVVQTLASGAESVIGPHQFYATGYYFDFLAVLIAFIVTAILVRGVSRAPLPTRSW